MQECARRVRVEFAHRNAGPGNIASGNFLTRVDKSLGLDHVWILDQNRVLDLRFGITRYEEGSRDAGSGFDLTKLGFSTSFASQLTLPSFPRIDAFNAFNHPRFDAPNTGPGNANFGRIPFSQVNQSRSVELAGKLFFKRQPAASPG